MNVWRYLGISIFLVAVVGLVATTQYPAAFGAAQADKKVEITAKPDKGDVKAGGSQAVDLTFKRGKDVKKDITLEATVEPKDKGVTVKVDAKVAADKNEAKLTVDASDKAEAGDYKVTVKAKSEGADDASETFTYTVKKATEPTPPVVGGGEKFEFKAFDPKGKKFYTEQTTNTTQTLKVMNQDVKQTQKQTFIIEWTPKPMDKDNWVVEQQIVGVKLNIDIGGNKIDYDSTLTNNPKNPMTDFFEQLTRQKLTYHIDSKKLEVAKIEGRDDFIKGLSEINPQMKSLLTHILSDSALKKMAEPTWYAFPKDGTLPKEAWKKDSELDLGPIGKYKTEFTFTPKKVDAAKAEIGIKTTLTYTAPTEKQGLPFVIKDAKLTTTDAGTGDAVFDRAKGRFESSTLKMDLKGDLTIEVGNMTTSVNLTQNQVAESKTHDELPAAWAKKK